MDNNENRTVDSAESSGPNKPERRQKRSYNNEVQIDEPASKIRKLNRVSSLTSDIFREVLTYCSRQVLNDVTQTTRQLNHVVQTYFQETPFIPINDLVVIVNSRKKGANMLLDVDKKTAEFCSKSIWPMIENGLGERLFRARRIALIFNNGFDINKAMIRKLKTISALANNSVITISFAHDSFFGSDPETLWPLSKLLSVVTPKCSRLLFDLKCDAPRDYCIPLLEYPAFLQYKEIEFTNSFTNCLDKDDVIKFLHQKSESQRNDPIRLRIMFPEVEWAEHLVQKIIEHFQEAVEISPPFQLQLCLSTSAIMSYAPLALKNSKIGEILRYNISKDEDLADSLLYTIERAPEFK
ncbi:hypothetical protein DdX_12060 [Ditylenchus destructor]|uniref:Uncharacterized protein n=1 Tax=Ditylenchus destructor TaxID=166010 RepID=A0AAD4R0R1_9BILA|nr:hypothetical protein DdX_12060 [Ditylenchus destructor]